MTNYKPNEFEFKMRSFDGSETTRTFSKEMLPDVLEEMEMFLRGCGFIFNGTLDIIEEDVLDETEQHSPHYFDFNRNR